MELLATLLELWRTNHQITTVRTDMNVLTELAGMTPNMFKEPPRNVLHALKLHADVWRTVYAQTIENRRKKGNPLDGLDDAERVTRVLSLIIQEVMNDSERTGLQISMGIDEIKR